MMSLWLTLSISAGPIDVSQRIDREIQTALKAESLTPAGPASDSDLVRRLYLDLLGRIPTADEAKAYLDDPAPNKADALIDRLLVHPEMALHWAVVLDLWLNGRPENNVGRKEFLGYLRDAISTNKPWDRIARELLLPSADDARVQPASYFLAHRLRLPKEDQVDGLTVAVASGLFGVRLECCKCHDHPYVDAWKQDHYYGMASFLSRMELVQNQGKFTIGERADGPVSFTRTNGQKVDAALMFLDGKTFAQPPLSKNQDDNYIVPRGKGKPAVPKFSARGTLADYALQRDNPYFRRAIVNRVWKQLMGRGLVEPEDQLHDENPASHPALFTFLADDFATNQFDLRRLLAGILRSASYQRTSVWQSSGDVPAPETYATFALKPLTPEQLALSLATATGMQAKKPGPEELRNELERTFATFAEKYESASGGYEATTAQALFMTYNEMMRKMLKNRGVVDLAKQSDDRLIDYCYLTVLSRRPDDEERKAALAYLKRTTPTRDQRVADLLWALLNSAEFRFNH